MPFSIQNSNSEIPFVLKAVLVLPMPQLHYLNFSVKAIKIYFNYFSPNSLTSEESNEPALEQTPY